MRFTDLILKKCNSKYRKTFSFKTVSNVKCLCDYSSATSFSHSVTMFAQFEFDNPFSKLKLLQFLPKMHGEIMSEG